MFHEAGRDWARETSQRTGRVMAQLQSGGVAAQHLPGLRQFGQLLACWRRQQGLSRAALAQISCLPPQVIAWLEWGLMTGDEVENCLPGVAGAMGDKKNFLWSAYSVLVTEASTPPIQQEDIS
jgi:hypothetical protein